MIAGTISRRISAAEDGVCIYRKRSTRFGLSEDDDAVHRNRGSQRFCKMFGCKRLHLLTDRLVDHARTQGQVEAEFVEYVRVAPPHQHPILVRGQARRLTPLDLRGCRRRAEAVKADYARAREGIQRCGRFGKS